MRYRTHERPRPLIDELYSKIAAALSVTSKSPVAFGNGQLGGADFDGVNTFSFATLVGSTYTLNRGVALLATSPAPVRVRSGITLVTAGFKLFCAGPGDFINDGDINGNGFDAVGGVAGASSRLGTLGIGTAGGAGVTNAVGNHGVNNSNGLQDANSVGGVGGAGGANAGGAGGAYTSLAANGGANELWTYLSGFMPGQTSGGNQAQLTIVGGGSGGGSGGSDNVAATSGGGGGGGGPMIISIYSLINNGTIRSHGGKGGNASGAAGNAGGGGGGAGGAIFLLTRYFKGNLPTVLGGLGGTGIGTGAAGSQGNPGHLNLGFM